MNSLHWLVSLLLISLVCLGLHNCAKEKDATTIGRWESLRDNSLWKVFRYTSIWSRGSFYFVNVDTIDHEFVFTNLKTSKPESLSVWRNQDIWEDTSNVEGNVRYREALKSASFLREIHRKLVKYDAFHLYRVYGANELTNSTSFELPNHKELIHFRKPWTARDSAFILRLDKPIWLDSEWVMLDRKE